MTDPDAAIALVGAIMDHFGVARRAVRRRRRGAARVPLAAPPDGVGVDLPVRAIVLGGAAGQPVRLYYRHHGTGAYTILDMAPDGHRRRVPGHDPGGRRHPRRARLLPQGRRGAPPTSHGWPRVAASSTRWRCTCPRARRSRRSRRRPRHRGRAPPPGTGRLPATGGESLALRRCAGPARWARSAEDGPAQVR